MPSRFSASRFWRVARQMIGGGVSVSMRRFAEALCNRIAEKPPKLFREPAGGTRVVLRGPLKAFVCPRPPVSFQNARPHIPEVIGMLSRTCVPPTVFLACVCTQRRQSKPSRITRFCSEARLPWHPHVQRQQHLPAQDSPGAGPRKTEMYQKLGAAHALRTVPACRDRGCLVSQVADHDHLGLDRVAEVVRLSDTAYVSSHGGLYPVGHDYALPPATFCLPTWYQPLTIDWTC